MTRYSNTSPASRSSAAQRRPDGSDQQRGDHDAEKKSRDDAQKAVRRELDHIGPARQRTREQEAADDEEREDAIEADDVLRSQQMTQRLTVIGAFGDQECVREEHRYRCRSRSPSNPGKGDLRTTPCYLHPPSPLSIHVGCEDAFWWQPISTRPRPLDRHRLGVQERPHAFAGRWRSAPRPRSFSVRLSCFSPRTDGGRLR